MVVMKVVQINTIHKFKSTGRNCYEMEQFLLKNGHECVTAFGHGKKVAENAYRINTEFEYKMHALFSLLFGLEGYFSVFATIRLISFLKKYKADVIHLHNLHGHYLNLPIFFRYLRKSKIPIVLHLHDCWIMSGGCSHPTAHDCNGWLLKCGNCPAKREYPSSLLFDFTRKMQKDKQKWFSKLSRAQVVGVSKWVADEGAKCYLNRFPITHVYNWINDKVFYPRNSDILARYGLDNDKFNIICVSAIWGEDSDRYRDLLKLADLLEDDMQIVTVGKVNAPIEHERIKYIGFTDSTDQLAELYSACDAYVHLSTADTFGKVIAEAMACGIPAVVYDRTACPEVVGEGCGYSIPAHNMAALLEKLNLIKEKGKGAFTENCVSRVSQNFNYEKNCGKTLNIYETLINNSKK